MDRIVTYQLLGEKRQATVKNAETDNEAKAAVLSQIAQSFHVEAITAVKPRKRSNLFATYADGFINKFVGR